ncbi:hypothetical protein A2962_05490 [Candidatus Woesebacteria bacterium RIFCSPLOWO2_01_FULL_39_61]|uniref:DUF1295 domain-containing protein n=2 Tax=Microgenomates group TaxID=1794810 RepID=A0A0H4TQ74_9BACT|nr:hypothetical protein [uncultured Microgenomates bacterium Rifle_16ft_4_minimus_37836]OGM28041.1 MAG: hypothetical protein A2692_05230 [Candidatus Woesebacteria bacterium RIFCSPHIGHO2_01_FULL_39_95]OGM34029.1 MAG: hypothetical protein A3D01_03800 [Candidatus Woesebacteria bacterium RIFCSPHIGHO2_02_FULL_39_13]OGM38287.1 MAG: hypothetical protein A3E13_05910 [Candidatus Woesebacteria bacterium RIFCSPHIGHO2_12_FULL_40_20]OGM67750.1 MAG: hypothetical protein A2962_05490 [Candidatus Woesebacteria 
MSDWQVNVVIVWGTVSLLFCIKGILESKDKRSAFGITPYLLPLGIFVWGDAVIFGLFWFVVSLMTLIVNDWIFFLLIISIFWVVRSVGETVYWINQQFSIINRNPPEKFWFHKYFHNDSVWFIHQIIWQCVTVVSLVTTIYLAKAW